MTAPRVRAFKPRMRPEQRRAAILAVALEEFATKGYDGATMESIASAADISRSVPYHYFESKQAIYVAVLEDQIERLRDFLVGRLAEQPNLMGKALVAADSYLLFAEENPGLWALLTDPSSAEPEVLTARRHAYDTIVEGAVELLEADIHAAVPTITEPRIALEFILAGAQGLVRYRAEHPETSRDEIVATLVQTVVGLSGLAATTC